VWAMMVPAARAFSLGSGRASCGSSKPSESPRPPTARARPPPGDAAMEPLSTRPRRPPRASTGFPLPPGPPAPRSKHARSRRIPKPASPRRPAAPGGPCSSRSGRRARPRSLDAQGPGGRIYLRDRAVAADVEAVVRDCVGPLRHSLPARFGVVAGVVLRPRRQQFDDQPVLLLAHDPSSLARKQLTPKTLPGIVA
jgi:hypothetical protein